MTFINFMVPFNTVLWILNSMNAGMWIAQGEFSKVWYPAVLALLHCYLARYYARRRDEINKSKKQ